MNTFERVVLVINPGSTSTKIAIFSRDKCLYSKNLRHTQKELDRFDLVTEQIDYRYRGIKEVFDTWLKDRPYIVEGVVGRGGIVKPIEGGTYLLTGDFMEDARSCRYGNHASNLGGLLAVRIASEYGSEHCYTVDPVSVDNMWDKARISGVPSITRVCRGHPLNVKRTARMIAAELGVDFSGVNFVVAHLGGGFSITALEKGKVVDVNDGLLGMGPFTPNRAGALPLRGIMDLCYSMERKDVEDLLSKNSGLKAYLGYADLREVLRLIEDGNHEAALVYDAFVYQIAKEIGAYFVALRTDVEAIIITGGIANSKKFCRDLEDYIGKLCRIRFMPGEHEMQALAEGAFRVIDGKEQPRIY